MNYSQDCIELVKKYEGFYNHAYRCSSDVLTIGFGHTDNVKVGDTCTLEQALEYLKTDLDQSLYYVNYYCTKLNFKLNQNQIDALVSFTFNCGCGNLYKMLKSCTSISDIPNKMLNYNKNCYGVVLAGLVKRRSEEIKLFNKGGSIMFDTVKKGSQSKAVGVLQVLLDIPADNIFGSKTYVAVVNYQRNHNLKIDGICGSATWNCLLKENGYIC